MPEVDVIRAQLFALQDKEYQGYRCNQQTSKPPQDAGLKRGNQSADAANDKHG